MSKLRDLLKPSKINFLSTLLEQIRKNKMGLLNHFNQTELLQLLASKSMIVTRQIALTP
jgi:hypothetical protein